jgi:non-ribosomal peptide synthetase component F
VAGYFVDLVALLADLSGGPTGGELLARARREALDAFAHQGFPFALLAERLRRERSSGLLQAALSWEKAPEPELAGLAAFAPRAAKPKARRSRRPALTFGHQRRRKKRSE